MILFALSCFNMLYTEETWLVMELFLQIDS